MTLDRGLHHSGRHAGGFTPIVQMVDSFKRNHKLGILWEAKVGSGSLLVCTSRLCRDCHPSGVRWLAKTCCTTRHQRHSPAAEVTAEQLRKWFGV
ncbi:MAG: hypothetical protein ACLSFT_09500 [Ruminococcus callidus]